MFRFGQSADSICPLNGSVHVSCLCILPPHPKYTVLHEHFTLNELYINNDVFESRSHGFSTSASLLVFGATQQVYRDGFHCTCHSVLEVLADSTSNEYEYKIHIST